MLVKRHTKMSEKVPTEKGLPAEALTSNVFYTLKEGQYSTTNELQNSLSDPDPEQGQGSPQTASIYTKKGKRTTDMEPPQNKTTIEIKTVNAGH